jgi:hypothetical protein
MGKLKGKVGTPGDMGTLSYTDASGASVTVRYDQPFSAELGIVANAKVSLNVITTAGGDSMAVAVAPICKGVITAIDYATGMGTIFETESKTSYPFKQNYLKESGFVLNQTGVTYTLVNVKGVPYATCLEA